MVVTVMGMVARYLEYHMKPLSLTLTFILLVGCSGAPEGSNTPAQDVSDAGSWQDAVAPDGPDIPDEGVLLVGEAAGKSMPASEGPGVPKPAPVNTKKGDAEADAPVKVSNP
jgi:hypothetical protein